MFEDGDIVFWDDPGGRVLHIVEVHEGKMVTMACGAKYPDCSLVKIDPKVTGRLHQIHTRCFEIRLERAKVP